MKNNFYYLENISIDSQHDFTWYIYISFIFLMLYPIVNSSYICHPLFALDLFYKMSAVTLLMDLSVSI